MPAIAKKGILYTEVPSVENRVVEGNQNPVTSGAVYKELGDTSVNNDLGANISNQIENLHTQIGKLPKYIDITVNCPANTWCHIALPDAISHVNKVINVIRPVDSDSNVYGIIWWPLADKQITILRINTNGTNLVIDNTEKTIKLRIWFC